MTQRRLWPAALVAALALTGCGSAADSSKTGPDSASGGGSGKLVVWDWKSGDKAAAGFVRRAGLDPDNPPTTWDAFVKGCAAITKATGAACVSVGNKEGYGIQLFLSGLGSGVFTPAEYDAWIGGRRDWNAAGVKKLFELWKQVNDQGLNTKGANSTALFNDAFATFEAGKAATMIGLMSDVGHWKDFNQFLGPENVGVMRSPVVTAGATPSLPYDGGIGYGVAKWTRDPALAADLVRFLTSTTALHVALSSKTQELMGRLSQQLLSGSVTVEAALKQLAASDQTG